MVEPKRDLGSFRPRCETRPRLRAASFKPRLKFRTTPVHFDDRCSRAQLTLVHGMDRGPRLGNVDGHVAPRLPDPLAFFDVGRPWFVACVVAFGRMATGGAVCPCRLDLRNLESEEFGVGMARRGQRISPLVVPRLPAYFHAFFGQDHSTWDIFLSRWMGSPGAALVEHA